MVVKVGSQFLLNTSTQNSEADPSVANLTNGNIITVWEGGRNGNIDGQLYNSSGSRVGPEIQVSLIGADQISNPEVIGLTGGGFAVTWQNLTFSNGQGTNVEVQLFDNIGNRVGSEFRANSTVIGDQSFPDITALSNGNLVVSWNDGTYPGSARFKVLSPSGASVTNEIVASGDRVAFKGEVAGLSDGSFVVAYNGGGGLAFQHFNALGTKVGTEIVVDNFGFADNISPSDFAVAATPTGGFVLTWQLDTGVASTFDRNIKAQVFNASGQKVGQEISVNVSNSGTQDSEPAIAVAPTGEFVISWTKTTSVGFVNNDIYAQAFDASGSKIGSEFIVSQTSSHEQLHSSVTSVENGKFLIAWQAGEAFNSNSPSELNGDNAGYAVKGQLISLSSDNTFVDPQGKLNASYRFFDTSTGDHFYTLSTDEKSSIQANLPNYRYEGVGWSTPDKNANTIDVFRFYDNSTKTHFFTTSASERDQIINTLPSYNYEGVAFQAYVSPDTAGSGGITLERFFNSITGLHHYAANAAEAYGINNGAAGPGWIDEGKAFTVHIPVDGMALL